MEEQGWRGLFAAVLLGLPAVAGAEPVDDAARVDAEPSAASESAGSAGAGESADSADALDGAVAQAMPGGAQGPVSGAPEQVDDPSAPVPDAAVPGAKKAKKNKGPKADTLGEAPDEADQTDDKGKPTQRIRVFGRVYAQASADEREKYERSLGIESARVGVAASLPNLEAEVSADLASKSILKDAFVRLADDAKRLRLYAGRFKSPFLQRSLESSWTLPLQGRGLVEDYLTDTNGLGGRRLGVMGEVRLKEAWGLKLSAGLFEGGEDPQGERLSEDGAARLSVRPFKFLTVGASTYLTQVIDGTKRHATAADAELTLGGLSLTGEVATGRLALGPFMSQSVLAYWTVPVGHEGWAVQPAVGAEALQLQGGIQAQGHAVTGGFNILLADSFKAQVQAERALRPGDVEPALELSLQLATRFR
ncbi:hypothetical protein D7V93_13410 [Corallococcus llansteffanensis]|uniref:Uncharacterized protein n=2 Tax=Corallococcus llansteffanensis TaxID=2316731 RepID=A0A3A8PWG2_9BACT|nr:hypothetical protein [Corallococcus llansteffanensis]RKH60338.1 hypothetical protein D7V93_13410 [Corallococcus llansteffanensis]